MAPPTHLSGERPPWFPTALYPFASRWIEVEGCKVHYLDEGKGPTLLMVHGNPTWSFLYRELVRGLSGHFRCIATDHPGFGLSLPRTGYGFTPAEHARVLEGFVGALELTDLTLFVQDWGGPTGLHLAVNQSERIRRLIIGIPGRGR
jgi:haloalkane dehalogenase